MSTISKLLLYFNTIRFLKPTQVFYQIVDRIGKQNRVKDITKAKNAISPRWNNNLRILIPELDANERYQHRFPIDDLLRDQIEILHEKHSMEYKTWKVDDASRLWNYNLHYLEYLIPLALVYKQTGSIEYLSKWKEILSAWVENCCGDGFEPYTISLRIPNLLISMEIIGDVLSKDLIQKIQNSIYGQYLYLIKYQEKKLLANHYFENLKTLVICSLLFQESNQFAKYFRAFRKQLKEQILSDGLHYERSIMYHKIVLEGILRVAVALKSAGLQNQYNELTETIQSMSSALFSLERGMGRTPLFNDAGDNVSKHAEQLLDAVKRIYGFEPQDVRSFPESGYFKLYSDDVAVMFDCGDIGPLYMSGHAHNDTLSFELSIAGKPLFVNAGTYQYQGDKRIFFRSNKAHNTMTVDNEEHSQLWGEHRAARRIREITASYNDDCVQGSFTSCSGIRFSRQLRLRKHNGIVYLDIFDEVKGTGSAQILETIFRLSPVHTLSVGKSVKILDEEARLVAKILFPEKTRVILHKKDVLSSYAPEIGLLQSCEVIEFTNDFTGEDKSHYQIQIYEMGA